VHLAFVAPSERAVRAFHEVALLNGGRDNGPPGERTHYFPGYYAAYVLDPDGYNVEAVHQPR
jgi:catechol 2,3-dioxygenase-like lactoylglutathione lyase family enzyme